MPAKPAPSPLAEARARLAGLLAERDALPDLIVTAADEVRVEDWLRLQKRQREIDEDIRQARLAVVPLQLEQAWARAEAAHAEETGLAVEPARLRELIAQLDVWPAPKALTLDERFTLAKARQDLEGTDAAHHAARDATCHALVRVAALEAELQELTGEPLEPGEGFRAAPRPMLASVTVGQLELGDLAQHAGLDAAAILLTILPGETPPRWLAHRFPQFQTSRFTDLPKPPKPPVERDRASRSTTNVRDPSGAGGFATPRTQPVNVRQKR